MNIYNNFKVKVSQNNEILNIAELLRALNEVDITDEIEIFLINLQNRINNSNYTNKDILSYAIQSHLLNYEANKSQTVQSNSESLKLMQSFNSELKKLSIISTKKDDNDSNKNIDYLTYTNENGNVEVLVCLGDNTLNEYIRKHSDKIITYTAKDIFYHFKEYVHEDLYFEKVAQTQNKNNEEIVREDTIKQQEYEEVKKYADTYSISGKIEVTVDPNGERLYRVKDGLFKFKTTNGIRVMEILQTPSINLDETDDLIPELERDEDDLSLVQTNIITDVNTHNPHQSYDSLPQGELSESKINEVMELLQKREIYGIELSGNDLKLIDITIKTLIESMQYRITNPNTQQDTLLNDYMEPLVIKYKQIKDGIEPENILSNLEIRMCEKYLRNKEYIETKYLDKNDNKKLELVDNFKNDHQSGLATIVMLLEIMLLALFIIMFSHLDI